MALCTEGTWKKCVGLAPCQPPGPQAESSVQARAPVPSSSRHTGGAQMRPLPECCLCCVHTPGPGRRSCRQVCARKGGSTRRLCPHSFQSEPCRESGLCSLYQRPQQVRRQPRRFPQSPLQRDQGFWGQGLRKGVLLEGGRGFAGEKEGRFLKP